MTEVIGDGLRLAVGTLTALPVPPPRRIDRRVGAVAMLLAPAAGLIPGLLGGGVAWLTLRLDGEPFLAAALTLGTLALATRGLHLDGLADTADGLAASFDRERALAVMRRGDAGPAGVAALVLVLLVQAGALAQALDRHGPVAAVVVVVAGRVALTLACLRGVPPARPEGLGATVAGTVPPLAALLGVVVVTGLAALVVSPVPAIAATGSAVAGVALLLVRAVRRLGGITGDVLGACVETATTAAAVALAMVP